jgi:hypothetical protein
MGCFEKLVKSHFLANVSAELSLARQTIKKKDDTQLEPSFVYNRKERKRIYDEFVYEYYVIEDIIDQLREDDSSDLIYYFQIQHIVFIYSQTKRQLLEAVKYSYNLNGDIPFCMSRHRINGYTLYTALIDTRLQFNPLSPN